MRARERKRRRNEVTRAGELIGALLAGYHVAEDVREHRVLLEWADIVGPRIATRTWPSPVQEGILRVRVSNSSWLHQLSFMRDELRARVNAHLGDPPLVTEVRLFLGSHRRREGDAPPPYTGAHRRAHRRRRRPLPPPARGAALAAIEAETASIDDDELRAVVREARRRLGT